MSVVEYIADEIALDSSVIHMMMLMIAFGMPHIIDVDNTFPDGQHT